MPQQKSDLLTWFKSWILRYAIKNSLVTNIFKNICKQIPNFANCIFHRIALNSNIS